MGNPSQTLPRSSSRKLTLILMDLFGILGLVRFIAAIFKVMALKTLRKIKSSKISQNLPFLRLILKGTLQQFPNFTKNMDKHKTEKEHGQKISVTKDLNISTIICTYPK